MRDAKTGQWWVEHPYRALANNSVAYTDGRPDVGRFMSEWLALYQSKSGERGIFNREAARRQAVKNSRRSSYPAFGTNPCNEIILRARQFCNLSEVVARPDDTFDTLARKVRIATILGTWQSTLTKFRYISRDFARNCEEERLLGVSVTGVMDCPLLNNTSEHTREVWQELKNIAIQTNYCWSDRLSINRSVAITCIKPSGTVSQLVGSSSGIHPCHAPFYIRRVRQDKRDPLSTFLIDRGFPWETDQLKEGHLVFSFPMRGAQGSIYRDDITAIDHLKLWQFINENWCEHKPSITVSVKEHEWPGVGSWVWEHFDELSGVSFLPHSEHNYTQAPFEAVDQTRLEQMEERMPRRVDWSLLSNYELEDHTTGTQELACSSGQCEI
jgi:ribonucleoside-diphosphate reductase alpha chain